MEQLTAAAAAEIAKENHEPWTLQKEIDSINEKIKKTAETGSYYLVINVVKQFKNEVIDHFSNYGYQVIDGDMEDTPETLVGITFCW